MFIKFPSIENHYREKYINGWFQHNPGLYDEKYIVFEKYDGANISFEINPNEEMRIYSRNQEVTHGNFYGVNDVLNQEIMQIFFDHVQKMSNNLNVSYRFYGELFGRGVLNRVNYGPDKHIRFFDLLIDGIRLSPKDFIEYFSFINARFNYDYTVHSFGLFTFEEALEFNVDINSTFFKTDKENKMEGVVILPYNKVYDTEQGSRFCIKKKHPNFMEKHCVPKKKQEIPENIQQYKTLFNEYLNESRLMGIFSKFGKIEDNKQIGKYIGLMLQDAIEDFNKEHEDVLELPKKERKMIYKPDHNLSKLIFKFID